MGKTNSASSRRMTVAVAVRIMIAFRYLALLIAAGILGDVFSMREMDSMTLFSLSRANSANCTARRGNDDRAPKTHPSAKRMSWARCAPRSTVCETARAIAL